MRTLTIVTAAALALSAGCTPTKEEHAMKPSMPETPASPAANLPPIDREAPAVVETATFALG